MVKFIGVDVADAVPPEPYMPPAAWPGLVTVTATVPGVAMADAGTAVVSCLPVTYVVPCFEPFQLTVASELKLLPLTVNVNAAPPDCALGGEKSVMTGTTPGCGVAAELEEPYPHPSHIIASNKTEIIFMIFLQSGALALGPTLAKSKDWSVT